MTSDIFASQPADEDLLAELYDLEHDDVLEDQAFYRELSRRMPGPVLDLGCGSGRLFRALLAGGATRVVGIDGSAALLRRAEARIASDAGLRDARAAERISLVRGDVRALATLNIRERFSLAIAVGVVPHLDGPEDALRLLGGARSLLGPGGRLVLDDLGPGAMPDRDLPLSVDWHRTLNGREVVRRSELIRRESPEGLRVAFSTIADAVQPDGTIARLPASHRLWYPSPEALAELVAQAGMVVEESYGSHDLEPLDRESGRRVFLVVYVPGAVPEHER
ncbi:MAG TPA: methyltransferase domain-containing protein [Candidatus Limnocylindria bacterium]|nr:methyltransferase domain-containing protein [Candidatus Limnocylindria bacterium]